MGIPAGQRLIPTKLSTGFPRGEGSPGGISGRKPGQALDRVGLGGGLVGPDPRDPWEAHCEAGFVALARVDRIEGDFEDQALLDLADRAEALNRLVPDEPVEPEQLLVGESEIGLADGEQLPFRRPGAEGEVPLLEHR